MLAAAALVAVPAGSTAPALAQEREPPPEAGADRDAATEMVVTATRREARTFDVPAATTLVGSDEFQGRRMRRTLPDALLDLPSTMVQRTAHGQASPYLRGFTGYHTVLLVDGVRLNNSVFRSGPNQYGSTVDSFTVERLEVVRGPGSVLYGSDAVGGTVNAVARRNRTFEPGFHARRRIVYRGATAEASHTVRAEVEGNADDLGFLLGGTTRNYGDLRAGSPESRLPGTGYRETDGDLRLDFRQSPTAIWTLAVQHADQDGVPRTHKTVDAVPFHGTDVGTELRRDHFQTRDLAYGRLTAADLGGDLADELEVTLSWHRQRETRLRDRTGGRHDRQGFDVHTWGVQAQFVRPVDEVILTYGVEAWHDDVDSFAEKYVSGALTEVSVQGPVADDARYDLAGVYLQAEVPLYCTGGALTAGVRGTYAAFDADGVDDPTVGGSDAATPGNRTALDDHWTNAVGSLRYVQPASDSVNLWTGVSQAFRTPSLSDLTAFDATSGFETPSPGLDPEDYVTAEVGAKVLEPGWAAQVTLWRTWIDGGIVASPTGRTISGTPEVRKSNVGDGWLHGVEAEASLRLGRGWTLSLGGSWMDGEQDQLTPGLVKVRRPVTRLMPLTGSATLAYEPEHGPFHAWISGRAAARQDRLSLKDATDTQRIPPGGTPGYAVLSLGAGVDITEGVTLSAALENVFDTNHRIHGSGVNEPGRNLVVALDLRF